MNEARFAARQAHRDYHWAWYTASFGTVAIVLLSAILLLPLRTAEPAMSVAASALPTPALPTTAWLAASVKQPPTF